MSKPPSANALREWLHPCLDAAREPSAPGPDGGAIGLAMRADAEKFDRFRYAVLRRALVDHLRQDRRQTERLLRAEVFGEASPPLVDFEREDVLEGEDGLTFESLTPGRWPVAELVLLAGRVFDAHENWTALVAARPENPVAFFAKHVSLRMRDRLRRGGEHGGSERGSADLPERGQQHKVAARLDVMGMADPECGGCLPGAAGMYRAVLRRIVEHLQEAAEGSAAPSYTLRKLFPDHAWPPGPAAAQREIAGWLEGRIVDIHGPRLSPDLCTALGENWDGRTAEHTGAALSESARWHGRADSFPSWPEVALWVADASPSQARNADLNTFQRRVSRIDAGLEPFVESHFQRLRRALETA